MTAARAATVALLCALWSAVGQAAAATPKQKIVGTIYGLPPKTSAVVSAVDPNTLEVLGAARVTGKGRYKVPAAAGVTMVFANVEGLAPLFAASAAFLPSGPRTRIDLTLVPGAASARALLPSGAVPPTHAVTVDWGITASIEGRRTRVAHVVEADLVRFGGRRCDLRIVTSDPGRRSAVEDEVAFQQVNGSDPSTAITFDPTPPTVRVQGDGTEADGGHTVTLHAVEIASGSIIAESSQSGTSAFVATDHAAREIARQLCDRFEGPPRYQVVVAGTHSAQFAYRTPEIRDPKCDLRDEADGTQMFSFESKPVAATVARRNGVTVVTLEPAPVLFTGTRTASYRFFRDGPACFPPTPVDTSGCGPPLDPLGVADFVFTQSKIRTTIAFPDYAGCPFTPLIDANRATGEAAFDPKRLASGGAVAFTFRQAQDQDEGDETQGLVNRAGAVTSWTVTFTPID